MAERYIYRDEPNLIEPVGHHGGPIVAIIHDTVDLRYYLLQEHSRQTVVKAITGEADPKDALLEYQEPYPVRINLNDLKGNTRIIKKPDIDSPIGVIRAPLTVYFAGAAKNIECPIQCQHCYEGATNRGPDSHRKPLMEEEIDSLLTQFHEEGVFTIRYTGPEVTLNSQITDWITRTRELGMSASMNTSGFFNNYMRDKLIDSGLQEAIFSIEGKPETENAIRGIVIPNAFDTALTNLKALSEVGIRTRINMTVGRHNMGEDLDYIVDLAARYCKGGVSLIPLRGLGHANEYLANAIPQPEDMFNIVSRVMKLRQQYPGVPIFTYHDVLDDPKKNALKYHPYHFQKNPCPAEANVYITVTGLVVACCQTMSLPNPDGQSFYFGEGDIRQNSFAEIWKHDPGLNRFRNIEVSTECSECHHYGSKCEGGCPAEYFTLTPELQDGKGIIETTGKDRLCINDFE